MSFKINVKCVRKSESVSDGDNTYSEITLQSDSGAVAPLVAPAPQGTEPTPPPVFGMMNGITLTVRDSSEAANYKVGETYEISVSPVAKK